MNESRPKITERILRGVKALKRVVDTGEVDIRMVIDKNIRDKMTPDEERCLDAFVEYERDLFNWMVNLDPLKIE